MPLLSGRRNSILQLHRPHGRGSRAQTWILFLLFPPLVGASSSVTVISRSVKKLNWIRGRSLGSWTEISLPVEAPLGIGLGYEIPNPGVRKGRKENVNGPPLLLLFTPRAFRV